MVDTRFEPLVGLITKAEAAAAGDSTEAEFMALNDVIDEALTLLGIDREGNPLSTAKHRVTQ